MKAGLLKDVIAIYKPELSKNDFGEQVQVFEKVYETKSQVKFSGGNRELSNSEVITNYTREFIMRYYIVLNENYQIEYNKRRYRILSIEDNRQLNYKKVTAELINE